MDVYHDPHWMDVYSDPYWIDVYRDHHLMGLCYTSKAIMSYTAIQ
jgi:hypothetical protein